MDRTARRGNINVVRHGKFIEVRGDDSRFYLPIGAEDLPGLVGSLWDVMDDEERAKADITVTEHVLDITSWDEARRE